MKKGEKTFLYKMIGENIRYYRMKSHYSQKELGEKVGKSRTSIVNIENGNQHPPIHLLIDISRELNVSIHKILDMDKLNHYTKNKEEYLQQALKKIESEDDKEVVADFINLLKK